VNKESADAAPPVALPPAMVVAMQRLSLPRT
jgi:hypothetical protein